MDVLSNSPAFHATENDTEPFVEVEHLEFGFHIARQIVRRSGGTIEVLFETQWIETSRNH